VGRTRVTSLIASLLKRRPALNSRRVKTGYEEYNWLLRFLAALFGFPPDSIIPQMRHNHSFISHRRYITLSVDKSQPGQVASVLAIHHIPCHTRYNNCSYVFNILKPTCYVMHQQLNIQQLYALPTLYLCVLYLSENKQRLVLLTA